MADAFGEFLDKSRSDPRSESRFNELTQQLNSEPGPSKIKYYCRVFVLFRPWEECTRCKTVLRAKKNDQGEYELPELLRNDEDFTCPHNELREYTELVNRIQDTKGANLMRQLDTLKTGTVQALVQWAEPVGAPKKEEPEPLPRL